MCFPNVSQNLCKQLIISISLILGRSTKGTARNGCLFFVTSCSKRQNYAEMPHAHASNCILCHWHSNRCNVEHEFLSPNRIILRIFAVAYKSKASNCKKSIALRSLLPDFAKVHPEGWAFCFRLLCMLTFPA